MSAGSVLHMTGRRKCTDLGGLFQSMPITAACGIVGALAISSFPLTSGFVSKSMVTQAAADGHLFAVWMALAAASAGVFLHAGIKFPWFVFFQKDSGLRPPDPPWSMRLAMLLLAVLCVGLGIFYEPLYALLPHPVRYHPYTGGHVVSQLQLLLFSGLAFFVMLSWLKRTLTVTLDTDWVYRVALDRVVTDGAALLRRVLASASRAWGAALHVTGERVRAWHAPGGPLVAPWSTGLMALWTMLLLLALLVSGYFW